MAEEKDVWTDTPSQWTNFNIYLVCILLCWLIIPIFYALWKYLEVRCYRFTLTTERLMLKRGVLSRVTDELELYRVKDTQLEEPFWQRMFSLGNVVLATSDRTHPILVIKGIRNASGVREKIREMVEQQRKLKHVREID